MYIVGWTDKSDRACSCYLQRDRGLNTSYSVRLSLLNGDAVALDYCQKKKRGERKGGDGTGADNRVWLVLVYAVKKLK